MRRLLLPYLLLISGVALAQAPAHHARSHRAVATHAARPTASRELAYYCDSGNTVKYHSDPNCRGLNRCSASVVSMPLSKAEASMDACKFCH